LSVLLNLPDIRGYLNRIFFRNIHFRTPFYPIGSTIGSFCLKTNPPGSRCEIHDRLHLLSVDSRRALANF
jgi:hypothetical protein